MLAQRAGLRWIRTVLALAVCASIIGLALGAMSYVVGRGRGRAALDGLILGAIPLVILLQVVPHIYESIGPLTFVFLAIGFVVLTLADRLGHTVGERAGRAVLFPTMLVHALADGAALALATSANNAGAHGGGSATHLALVGAVLVHRVPEGVLLTGAFYRSLGAKSTFIRLATVAFATVVGAVLGGALLRVVPDAWLDGVVAFGVGAMLRFALHTHDTPPDTQRSKSTAGIAFLLGISGVLLIPNPESVLRRAQPMELSVARSFFPLFIETAPSLALACIAVVAITRWLQRQQNHRTVTSVARRLFAPELLLLTAGWFGWSFTVVQWVGSVLWAGVISLLLRAPSEDVTQNKIAEQAQSGENVPDQSVRQIAALLGWALAGLALAAMLEAAIRPGALVHASGSVAMLLAMTAALVLPTPWPVMLPVVAVLHHKGMSTPVVLSALWCRGISLQIQGAMAHGPSIQKARYWLAGLLSAALVFVGLSTAGNVIGPSALSLHSMVFHRHEWFEWLAAGLVAIASLVGVVALGPRQLWLSMGKFRENVARIGTPSLVPVEPTAE